MRRHGGAGPASLTAEQASASGGDRGVYKTSDGGKSWEEASPDLTRADPEKLGFGGGPITNEGAGGEIYATLSNLLLYGLLER